MPLGAFVRAWVRPVDVRARPGGRRSATITLAGRFPPAAWTRRHHHSPGSSTSSPRASASPRSSTRSRRTRACPSRRYPFFSRRCTDARPRARLPARRGRGGARHRRGESAGSSIPRGCAPPEPWRARRLGPRAARPPRRRACTRARRPRATAGSSACRHARSPRACRRPRAPEVVRLTRDGTRDLDALVEELALAGYERVERVEERGQIAVRGGLVDIFPSTGREPLRVEFFGDDIEQIRAFSPFTQRALHPVDDASIYPARERVAGEPRLDGDETERVPLLHRPSRPRLADRRRREPLGGGGTRAAESRRGGTAGCAPRSQPHVFEAQRPAIAARGLAEAENELAANGAAGTARRRHLPASGRGAAHTAPAAQGRGGRHATGRELASDPSSLRRQPRATRLRLARPRDRPPPGHAGLPQAPTACRQQARSRAPVVRRPSGRRLRRPRGPRRRQAPRLRDEGRRRRHARLPLPRLRGEDRLYVPHEQIGKVSRYIGADAKAPALSKLGGKAWQNLKSRARASVRELAGELLSLYARRRNQPGQALDLTNDWLERLESSFPYRETEDQLQAIEAVKEDLEAGRPMDRLVCGDVGFGKTEVAVRAAFARAERPTDARPLPDHHPRRAALEHVPRALSRLPGAGRDGVALPHPRRPDARSSRVPGGQGRRPRSGRTGPLARRHREGPGARRARRGTALRCRPEGAPSRTPAGGRRARALRDPDPADAAHVALGASRHLDHRDAALRASPGADERRRVRRGADQEARSSASTREEDRRSTSTTASSRSTRPRGSSRSSARRSASSSRTGRCPRRSSRSGCTRSSRVTRTSSSRRRSSNRASTSAGEHAGRRARGRTRARAAVPDPWPRRPLRRACLRLPLLSGRIRAHAGGARAALDARRPHGARLGFQIAMRGLEIAGRRSARAGPSGPRRRARASSSTSRCSTRRSRSSRGAGARRPGQFGRRAGQRLPARVVRRAEALKIDLHRRMGLAEDKDELRELVLVTVDLPNYDSGMKLFADLQRRS